MKTIYLIRHAESLANSGGRSLPDREIPLSATGQKQAEKLITRLPAIPCIFTSEFLRTQQTAAPYLSHWGFQANALAELNEFSYLPLEWIDNMTAEQRRPMSAAYWARANPLEKCGQNTDSFAEFSQRIDDFLIKAADFPAQSLCFTHGIWIAMLTWKLLGFPTDTSEAMQKFRQFQPHLPMANTAIWELQQNHQGNRQIRSSAL